MNEEKSLNQRIAELAGYTVKEVPNGSRTAYRLIAPDGKAIYVGSNEALCWTRGIPDYEHDFNAILAAIDGKDCLVKFQPDVPIVVTIYDTGWSLFTGQEKKFEVGDYDEGVTRTVTGCAAQALYDWLTWEATAYADNAEDGG